MPLRNTSRSYSKLSQRPISITTLTATTPAPDAVELMPRLPLIVAVHELGIRLALWIEQRSVARASKHLLRLPLFPHAYDHAASDEHCGAQPPQPGQALREDERGHDGGDHEVRRRVDYGDADGGGCEGERAGEKAPHDGVEEEVHAEEGLVGH